VSKYLGKGDGQKEKKRQKNVDPEYPNEMQLKELAFFVALYQTPESRK
jgi:hypothetical protein